MKKIIFSKTYSLLEIKDKMNDLKPLIYSILVFLTGLFFSILRSVQMRANTSMTIDWLYNTDDKQYAYTMLILTVNLLCCLLHFLFGFSVIGKIFILVVLFVYSFFQGLFLISAYNNASESMIIFLLFYILPNLIFSIIQISSAVQSIYFSSDLYNNFFKNEQIKTKIRTYLLRYALIVIMLSSGGVLLLFITTIRLRFNI